MDLNYYNLGSPHILTNKNVNRLQLFAAKLIFAANITRFAIHKIVEKRLKTKTWTDYLETIKVKNR